MTWLYKDEEQEKGPFSKSELQDLINKKVITAQTLVRKDTDTDWRPLKEFAKSKPASPKASPESPKASSNPPVQDEPQTAEENETPADAAAEQPETKICSQCGQSFPADQVVTFDGKIICSACKPAFVQKIKEGAAVDSDLRYGGFWIRFGAKIIDGLVLGVIQMLAFIPLYMFFLSSMMPEIALQNPEDVENNLQLFIFVFGTIWLVLIFIFIVYLTFFVGKFAATPGKMACGLKIVAPDGSKISYLRAFGRVFGEWLNSFTFGIGYIIAGFDREKRALHDIICSTRVVHK